MNLKRFTGRTSREALALVRQSFGQDAVVMSTRPCAEGVEVLAMAPESLQQLEKLGTTASVAATAPRRAGSDTSALAAPTALPRTDGPVEQDVERLAMSTLSFQDYVRERMLKRRRSELAGQAGQDDSDELAAGPSARTTTSVATPALQRTVQHAQRLLPARQAAPERTLGRASLFDDSPSLHDDERQPSRDFGHDHPTGQSSDRSPAPTPGGRASMAATVHAAAAHEPSAEQIDLQREQHRMLDELRSMRGLIEQRFGALAFLEKMQRQPRQALLSHKLLETGLSPALVRKLVDGLPTEGDETDWAAAVLQRNLLTGESDSALEDVGGVYALIGPTGVGKTTSTAKLAAAFAARHGAGNLGLITLDAYRVAAHEQLRAYGRILGVPVHTAHDRASLEDLLELLAAKRMVLIDTAGMAQRDTRTKELLDMLSHRSVNRLLVVNAAAQGETTEDVLSAYRANTCRGVILSKIDEAVKLGPALDALIRHKLKVLAVANGQRVPEDWHRMSAQALVQRALRYGGSSAWKLDTSDVNLVFTAQAPVGSAAEALAQGH
ncbi:MAG: flagellar biosynthesis protein FlhF [Rubrivivax sp.]|nr:flagellar biosynthesis protein FlhF [Rubrivivax sp.]